MEESGLNGLYSDAGRNEGYWLREFLHETCYDSRAKPGEEKWSNISQEMIAEIVAIRKLETTGEDLIKTIHPHPTMSEAVMEAAAAAYDEVIHL